MGVDSQYAGHSYLTDCLSRESFAVVALLFNSLTELCIIQQLRGRGGSEGQWGWAEDTERSRHMGEEGGGVRVE